ncbi:MAG: hypothetical protein ACNA8O_11855 [Cyanobacteriota bacterium]
MLTLEQQLAQQQQQADTAQQTMAKLLTTGQLDHSTAEMLGQAVRDAQVSASATRDRLDAARLQLQQLQARPDGAAMAEEVERRVQAFLAADRTDTAVRRQFNSWLTTLGLAVQLHHQQPSQPPLMVVQHTDGTDAVELHQARPDDGLIMHVRIKPEAMADAWETYGTLQLQADGSQTLVIDGGAALQPHRQNESD